jgi:tetratricopeptide (TPR) repeat protein
VSDTLFEQYKAALRRGHMAALAGELEDALAAYDEAGRLVPDRALPMASRGTVLHRLDRWPEAAEAFEHALQLAPDDEAALRARATARADRGMRSGAAADFERLAFVLDVAGRAGPAADAARRATELQPSEARQALADRLATSAAQLAEAPAGAARWTDNVEVAPVAAGDQPDEWPGRGPDRADDRGDSAEGGDGADDGGDRADHVAVGLDADDDEPLANDPWSAAFDEGRLAGLGLATSDDPTGDASRDTAGDNAGVRRPSINDAVAYDMLDALRAGMDAEDAEAAETGSATDGEAAPAAAESGAAAEDTRREGATPEAAAGTAEAAQSTEAAGALEGDEPPESGAWPPIDLPSPPPAPMVGPPPDPEELLAEAALALESNEVDAARDLMLTAASVHRAAGRIDAALEICLNLLSIAPGDPRVHLAIANLQLDRGWSGVATEKLDLLVRLTSLTGDTQAEADVHGLASERLRDDPAAPTAAR